MANSVTPRAERVLNGRIGGLKSQTPDVLAAKLARDWPTFTEAQKNTVRVLLRPVLNRRTP